jgi:diaminopimelate decarboxylase
MHHFRYVGSKLYCEEVAVERLAKDFGTPLFVYSERTLTHHYQRLSGAMEDLDHLVCYAVKANSNLAVLRVLSNLGSGFDIVSAGELQRVIAAGGDPRCCVYAGVGKTEEEIAFALKENVYSLNVESIPELDRINRVAAKLKKRAPVALRVNPNVDAKTHAKITTGLYENKFGIAFEEVEAVYAQAAKLPHLSLRGVQMHIGSQLTSLTPFDKAVRKIVPLATRLKQSHGIEFLSIGGGIGIIYEPALASGTAKWWEGKKARNILTPEKYADRLAPKLKSLGLKILLEPGRFITGNAGILVSRVEYVKKTAGKNFVIVDSAMNDLIRPAFYEAYHEIVPTTKKKGGRLIASDVVGPICETGDQFCKDRPLPKVSEGDYMAIMSAGAYGFVMASNYNSRPFAAEVLVRGKKAAVVRERQPVKELWRHEKIADWSK